MSVSDFHRAIRPRVHLRFGRLRADPEAFRLVQRVAAIRGVSLSAMLRRSRGRDRDAAARQLAMYLVHVVLGRPQEVVAELFGRDRTTVAHACQRLEDDRDIDGSVEAEISRIESILPSQVQAVEHQHAA